MRIVVLRIACLGLVLTGIIIAHPHVWVDNTIEVVFDESGLARFDLVWRFDEMYSGSVLVDYDDNRNGRLDAAEVDALQKDAFVQLSDYPENDFLTYLYVDGEQKPLDSIEGFTVRFPDDGRMTYSFSVPVALEATSTNRTVVVSTYDATYYTEFLVSGCSVREDDNSTRFDYELDNVLNEDRKYYYDQVMTEDITLTFRSR
jgi:ABC-type uncharacterized transport system substrate-binding protein